MLADKSGVVRLLMVQSHRERSAYEKFSVSKPSRIPIAVRRDAVEEIYRRSSGNGFDAFPRAYQKRFRHVSATSSSASYHAGRLQIHGGDLAN